MEVTTERLQTFVGGQAEIQNAQEGYLFRGQIASAEVVGDQLTLRFEWLARMEGGMGHWVLDKRTEYKVSTLFYNTQMIGPGETGSDRLCLTSGVTAEIAVLFPPNGSRLARPEGVAQ
jgi:hypothetical protein